MHNKKSGNVYLFIIILFSKITNGLESGGNHRELSDLQLIIKITCKIVICCIKTEDK